MLKRKIGKAITWLFAIARKISMLWLPMDTKKRPPPRKVIHKGETYVLAKDVAEKLGISPSKIQNGIRNHAVRSIKEHGRLYVVVASVENFLIESKRYKPGTLWKSGWSSLQFSLFSKKIPSKY